MQRKTLRQLRRLSRQTARENRAATAAATGFNRPTLPAPPAINSKKTLRITLTVIGVLAAVWIVLAMIRGSLYEVGRIEQHSMAPTYQDGDTVVVKRVGTRVLPMGSVVAVKPAGQKDILIKRVTGRYGHETPDWPGKRYPRLRPHTYWLSSDNPKGAVDSRTFGPVKRDDVVGVVIGKTTKLDWLWTALK